MSKAEDVFEILMRENADCLLAFIRSSVADRHTADDIFQETMLVAWKKLDVFDRERSFGKWIRGISCKLILAHFRRSGKSPINLDEASLDWLESRFDKVQALPGDLLSEKLEALRECISRLGKDNRQAIEARYLHQFSLDELVRKFDVAMQTIKKRLYRSKLQLETCLSRKLGCEEL